MLEVERSESRSINTVRSVQMDCCQSIDCAVDVVALALNEREDGIPVLIFSYLDHLLRQLVSIGVLEKKTAFVIHSAS
ncbi:hypothetical protein D3C85_1379110 [compost metagenome]